MAVIAAKNSKSETNFDYGRISGYQEIRMQDISAPGYQEKARKDF
jgi:hypothetical protein